MIGDTRNFNVLRYGGGFETSLFRRTSLEVYYERMRCTTCVDPNTNVLTVNLNVYLRRKKEPKLKLAMKDTKNTNIS